MNDYKHTSYKHVPWDLISTGEIKVWRWLTPHFDAQIRSDGIHCSCSITDRTQGRPTIILNDFGKDFKESEKKVLEFIAKSYPVALGYRRYAGELATTFVLNDGTEQNLGHFEGKQVIVQYLTEQNDIKESKGFLQITHHTVEITTGEHSSITIAPSLIKSIRAISGRAGEDQKGLHGRLVLGKPGRGCTGRAGFISGSVVHDDNAPWCPIHRV